MSTEKNEIMTTEASTFLTEPINLNDLFAEEFDGLRPSFERIKIPAGGGISFEVPGDDPDSPDTVKEFTAVILHHHPVNSYFKDKLCSRLSCSGCMNETGSRWRSCCGTSSEPASCVRNSARTRPTISMTCWHVRHS